MQPIGKRARQACIACNARRVKCNVTESMPCRNCLADGQRCEVRESRRGKHPRRRLGNGAGTAKPARPPPQRQAGGVDEVAASEALVTLLRDSDRDRDRRTSFDTNTTVVYADADVDELNTGKSISPGTIPAGQHAVITSTESEAEASSVFLGESNTLRYVHADAADGDTEPPDDTSPGGTVHLLHQVPEADSVDVEGKPPGDSKTHDDSDNAPTWAAERRRVQMQFLQTTGALTFPPAATVDSLLDAYFRWFHPCFAVVDESDTRQKQRAGTLSPLLLQAMLFIGATHAAGDDADTTQKQKYTYYNRCKDLYDADYERDKVTIIQSVFLMSFWRSGPFLEKDTRHWLATAISLAQSKAMHRSAIRVARTPTPTTSTNAVARQMRQLKQRLWWSIYTRKQQCAAALGLPIRISDDDCDVAMLLPQDFEFAFDGSSDEGVAFQVGTTGLARILGTIIRHGYAPGKSLTATYKATLRKELRAWKPPSLDAHLEDEGYATSTFYTRLLHMSYNNLLILIYRPAYINQHTPGKDKENDARITDEEGRIALDAAAQNSRLVEDLVAAPSLLAALRHAPLHVITNLFNTLCMHTIHLRRLVAQGRRRGSAEGALTIAEHRAKVCLLGLQELQRTWDVRNWILQLFFQYLDRSTAARLSVDEGSLKGSNMSSTVDMAARVALPVPVTEPFPLLTGMECLAYTDPPGDTDLLLGSPWTVPTLEEQQIYLFSQMETDNLAFGEGGGLCGYWGPSVGSLALAPSAGVDNMTDFLERV